MNTKSKTTIAAPSYENDETLSWEERYFRLLGKYRKDTTYLLNKVGSAERLLKMVSWAQDMALDFVKNLNEEITKFLEESTGKD